MTTPDMQRAIQDLQDAMTVTAALQLRHSEIAKDHAQWLADHTRAIAESRERGRATDERIDKLVSSIGELIRRQK